MGLVKFALIGIDFLGWPVIALLYPLFASIRAVENGSINHMRKLVIYWTLFSLFSLFELAFVKVIEWVPFWSGIRLVLSFCLVMPQFEGSCLAYQGLVCLVIDRFGMLKKERHCKRATFSDVLEKYIKENGSEALEKFIASEMTSPEARVENRCPETPPLEKTQEEWTCDLCKITLVGESTLNAHLQSSKHKSKLYFLKASLLDAKDTGPSSSQQVQRTHPKQPKSPLLKKAQQEWTCDLCKVTTASKSMLNAHLQGSKHKFKLESPKASLINAKDTALSPLAQHAQSVSADWDLKGTYETAEVKEILPPKETAKKWLPETLLLKKACQEWTCDLCKVTTTSEITLNGHLNGSKHKAKLESTLKESLLDSKDTGPSSPLVQHAHSVSAAWDLTATYAATEDKELMPPQETAEKRLLEIPLVKKNQQEWTGDLCKVTAESESTLNGDLQGRKHKSKIEPTLEASLLIANDTGSSPSVQHAQSDSAAWDLKGTYAAAEVEELMTPKETAEMRCPGTPLLKKSQPEWTCDLCKVTTTSDISLNGDLNGCKHKAKLESTMKESSLDGKDTGPSPLVQHAQSVSAAWDLNGTYAFAEDREIMPPKETAEKRLPETPRLKKSKQEWTGDLCKVTAETDSTLNGDLQGSKHKSKLEPTLEASLLDEKVTGPSPLLAQSLSAAGDLNGTYPAAEDKDIMPPKEAAEERRPGSQHKCKVETTLKASLLHAQDTGPSPLVQHAQSVSSAWDLKGTYVATEVEEAMPPKEIAEKRRPETHILKKFQPEWTCDLCKVTTSSEITLNSHLHGSKHKAKYEATLQESFLELEKLIASQTEGECSVPYRDAQIVESVAKNGSAAPKQVQYAQSIEVPKRTDANIEVKVTKTPPEASRAETHPLKKEWSCGLCKVKTTCEQNLSAHFLGSKHKSKLESLKAWKRNLFVYEIRDEVSKKYWCAICNLKLLSYFDVVLHLKGKRHTSNIDEMEKT